MPSGVYRIKIVASDRPDNNEEEAFGASESAPGGGAMKHPSRSSWPESKGRSRSKH